MYVRKQHLFRNNNNITTTYVRILIMSGRAVRTRAECFLAEACHGRSPRPQALAAEAYGQLPLGPQPQEGGQDQASAGEAQPPLKGP